MYFFYNLKKDMSFEFFKLKIEMNDLRKAWLKSIPLFWKRSQKCKEFTDR